MMLRLRQESMVWGRALLDASYIVLFWALFLPARPRESRWAILLMLVTGVLLLHIYVTRLLFAKISLFWLRGVLSGLVALLGWLLAVKIWLFPHTPLSSAAWLAKAFGALPRVTALPPPAVLFLLTFFIWWRGVSIGSSHLDFRQFAARFRWQLLLLAAGVTLLATIAHETNTTVVWLFFAAAGFTFALKRMEDVGEVAGRTGRRFDLRWLFVLAGISGVLLLLGALLELVFTDRHIAALGRALSPLLWLLGQATKWVIWGLLRLFSPLLTWVIHTLAPGGVILPTPTPQSPHNVPAGNPVGGYPAPAWLHVLLRAGGYALLAALFLGVAFFIVLALYKQWQESRVIEETHTALAEEKALIGDAGTVLAAGREKLRRLWERLRHLRGGAELLAAISIRNIYANVTRLAAQQGYPRRPAETPYEYLAKLRQAFPGRADALRRITEAYVQVEYGHVPTGRGTLAALRQDWQQIRRGVATKEAGRDD